MTVDPRSRDVLIRAFRKTGDLSQAARKAGVSEADAAEVLRSEGFDLDTSDWFFESTAAFYRRAWVRSRRARRRAARLASGAFGRLPGAKRLSESVADLAARAEAWAAAWAARTPVRKSVVALIVASFFLTTYWLVDPEVQPAVAGLFLASFAIGAGILYVHTRSSRLLGSAVGAVLAILAYTGTEGLSLALRLSFRAFFIVEGLRAILVAFLGWAFLDAIRQATGFLERLRVHVPLLSTAATLGLFAGGTVAAFAELFLLAEFSPDPASAALVTRYGLSYLLWAFASASLLFTHVYLLYLAGLTAMGKVTTQRIAIAMITGVVLLGFVATNYGTVLVTTLGPRPGPMRLGIHAGDVGAAFAGPWDPFVHVEVVWEHVEGTPGVYDWSEYDPQLDRADREGIEVYLLLGTAPPAWFSERHADAAMRDQLGRVFTWVDEDPRVERRRVWEYSFASEAVVQAKLNFTRAAAARYAGRPSVIAVSIQNEPSWPADVDVTRIASYDGYTIAAFREDLQARFGDIEAFNAVHGTAYASWSQVDAPRSSGEPAWADWLGFRERLLEGIVDELMAAVREGTDKPVTAKIPAHYMSRYVVVQTGLTERVLRHIIEASDVVSLDLYPLSRGDLRRALAYFRGLAGDKRIWVAEFNLLLGSSLPGSGSAMYASLVEMSRVAERAILFTWEGHYLYGVRLYPSVPGLIGIAMFREVRDGGAPLSAGLLLPADVAAVPNLYGAYVLGSEFANLPVLPWPVLLLLLVPIPIADVEKKRRWKRTLRAVALALLVVAAIVANFAPAA